MHLSRTNPPRLCVHAPMLNCHERTNMDLTARKRDGRRVEKYEFVIVFTFAVVVVLHLPPTPFGMTYSRGPYTRDASLRAFDLLRLAREEKHNAPKVTLYSAGPRRIILDSCLFENREIMRQRVMQICRIRWLKRSSHRLSSLLSPVII